MKPEMSETDNSRTQRNIPEDLHCQKQGEMTETGSMCTGLGTLADLCEHGDEHLVSIKDKEFVESSTEYYMRIKDSVPGHQPEDLVTLPLLIIYCLSSQGCTMGPLKTTAPQTHCTTAQTFQHASNK